MVRVQISHQHNRLADIDDLFSLRFQEHRHCDLHVPAVAERHDVAHIKAAKDKCFLPLRFDCRLCLLIFHNEKLLVGVLQSAFRKPRAHNLLVGLDDRAEHFVSEGQVLLPREQQRVVLDQQEQIIEQQRHSDRWLYARQV